MPEAMILAAKGGHLDVAELKSWRRNKARGIDHEGGPPWHRTVRRRHPLFPVLLNTVQGVCLAHAVRLFS